MNRFRLQIIWAASWQNQQNDMCTQRRLRSAWASRKIRVFAVSSMGSSGPKLSSCGQRRLWSDWADAQADLSLRWVHSHYTPLWKSGGYTGFALSFRNSVFLSFCHNSDETWIYLRPVGQCWSNFIWSIIRVGERLRKILGQIGSKLFPWQQNAPIDL